MRDEKEVRRVLSNLDTLINAPCKCPFPKYLFCQAQKQTHQVMADMLRYALGEHSEIGEPENIKELAAAAMRTIADRN